MNAIARFLLRHFPIALAIALAILYLLLERSIDLPAASPHISNGVLSDVDETRIHVLLETSKLLISLTLALIAGVGYFVKRSVETYGNPSAIDVLGLLSIICAVTSIFFGQMTFNVVLLMLAHNALPTGDTYALRQYLFFLAALLLSIAYANYSLWRKRRES